MHPTIEVDVSATVTLSVREVWPDGDVPEVIDAEAVARALTQAATRETAGMWGLLLLDQVATATVTVTVTPVLAGPAPGEDELPGMPPRVPAVASTAEMLL